MTKRANTYPGAGPSPSRLVARRLLAVVLVAFVVISSVAAPIVTSAQTNTAEELGPPDADVNCPNFLSQADAQAVYDAAFETDGSDIYGLDDGPEPNDLACDGERTELGTEDLASCANFRLQVHAQALFDIAGDDDPYNLDANGNGDACDLANFSGGGDDDVVDDDLGDEDLAGDEPLDEPLDIEPIPSDLPPSFSAAPEPTVADRPDAEGCDVDVQAGRAYVLTDCDDGTVDAGFLPFEGFDDFAERAQNGFGAFDDTSAFAAPAVETRQSAAPVVEPEQAAAPAAVEAEQALPVPSNGNERPAANSDPRVTESEQPARSAKSKTKQNAKSERRVKARQAKKRAEVKLAKQKQLKLKRAKQRRARLQEARATQQRDHETRQVQEEQHQREQAPRR